MQDGEINITLETLFEILRMEKKRGELQQLSTGFLAEVRTYLEHKEGIAGDDSERQLENVHKIIEELFNVRERKLLELARTRGIEIEGLTETEKEFYVSQIEILKKFRGNLMTQIKTGTPQLNQGTSFMKPVLNSEEIHDPVISGHAIPDSVIQLSGKTKVVFLSPVPRFVGKGLEVFGPFNTGEETELSDEVAELLISKGRAKKA